MANAEGQEASHSPSIRHCLFEFRTTAKAPGHHPARRRAHLYHPASTAQCTVLWDPWAPAIAPTCRLAMPDLPHASIAADSTGLVPATHQVADSLSGTYTSRS